MKKLLTKYSDIFFDLAKVLITTLFLGYYLNPSLVSLPTALGGLVAAIILFMLGTALIIVEEVAN